MAEAPDKIRVLLIDDNPSFLSEDKIDDRGKVYSVPVIADDPTSESHRPEISELFELRWIATAREARHYRDLVRRIGFAAPHKLTADGLIPEIICFDYALTGMRHDVCDPIRGLPQDVVTSISPMHKLQACATSIAIPVLETPAEPDTGHVHDDDNHGCYAGGMVFSSLSDHPCAPVALTRKGKDKTVRTEAALFEWLLEEESDHTFGRKGRPNPTWNDLLIDGAKALQDRIAELAKVARIQISLDDLLALADEKAAALHPILTLRSRYGRRRLPTEGLFIDVAQGQPRLEAARNWARRLLAAAIQGVLAGDEPATPHEHTLTDFLKGRALADKLWTKYLDKDLMVKRQVVSQVCLRLSSGGSTMLTKIEREAVNAFGIDTSQNITDWEIVDNFYDIRDEDYTARQKRWSALMVTLRVVHRRWSAAQIARDDELDQRYGNYLLRGCDSNDVYLALYPLPTTPLVLPWHGGKDCTGEWKDLSRLKVDKTSIALVIGDILAGLDWGDTRKDRPTERACGFLPGERLVMQWYAESLYTERDSGWTADDFAASLLRPETTRRRTGP
jgi:hypothetical protein